MACPQNVNSAFYPLFLWDGCDTESSDAQLFYEWRVFLHHNNHEHPDFVDSRHEGRCTLAPVGCDGVNIYYYRIELTVTDPAGLATTTEVSLFPDCGRPDSPPTISDLPDQVIRRGGKAGPVAFIVSDAEVAAPYLELRATSSNPALVPDGNIVFGDGGSGRTITVRPAAGRSGTAIITVLVNDGPNTVSTRFNLEVTDQDFPVMRTGWAIGTESNESIWPYRPTAEFGPQNNINDRRPGRVTRLPGDPEYVEATNPVADDDFYFAGLYPSGFNGLLAPLRVPNDEPAVAWERAHTVGDRTNRFHFLLDPLQVASNSRFRLAFKLVSGGSSIGGVTQPGFADHDMVVRFIHPAGGSAPLFSKRVSLATNVVLDFAAPAAGALAGANTVEIVRNGPVTSGVSYYIQYDYVRLESYPVGNTAPVMALPSGLVVDELAPLSLVLRSADADLPKQALTWSMLHGPPGLTVSTAGAVSWIPTAAQRPGRYEVVVEVRDDGTPPLSDRKSFEIVVNAMPNAAARRTVWQVGIDNDPSVLPYRPTAEFSPENGKNDLSPGKVTRLPGDPEYVAAGNPGADDDFYFLGEYPAGFNGLTARLTVPNDEPAIAWERAHTVGDRTNRMHFVVDAGQVGPASAYRLNVELVNGGTLKAGVLQPGFGDHDMEVRFRNGAGTATPLFAQRVSQTTNLVLDFTAPGVGATAGANTIEIVRTGPTSPGVSFFIQYDYLRLENLPSPPPGFAGPARITGSTSSKGGSGSEGGVTGAVTVVHHGVVSLAGHDFLTLSFASPEPAPTGVRYVVESTSDLLSWTEADVVFVSVDIGTAMRTTTVRDLIPMGAAQTRFLWVRRVTQEATRAE